MIRRTIAALLLSGLLTGGAAAGQAQADRNCRDDRGVDRCSDEQQRRTRALYGAKSIEEHAAAGDQVRRIFYVDGYGRDLVMIAFVRTAGRDPTLSVHHPQRDGERPRPEPIQAAVPQDVWDEVIERSEHFDRSFVPSAAPASDALSICLHSWVYTIEAVDPPQRGRPVQVRRKSEDACEDGPGGIYAVDLQRIALRLVPHCAALDPEQHRNPASMLATCRILHGDRLAAAEVLNLADAFRQLDGPEDARQIAGHFAQEAQIDWAGTNYRGSGHRAAEFWTGRLGGSGGYPTNMYFERVVGESGSRVRLTGRLSRTADTPRGQATGSETATIEQVWVRDVNGVMQVQQATIGPWRARPER